MTAAACTLEGRVALVTGGARGIGRAIALGFAREGAAVAIVARTAEDVAETAAAIEATGARAHGVAADLTDVARIPALVDDVERALGPVDVLVNSAGVLITGPALDVTEADWDATADANVRAVFFCCQAVGRRMVARGYGKIVNIGSTFAETGFPGFAVYCASKGGVLQLTRALATEWAGHGVNVNAIGPGATRTPLNAHLLDDPAFLEAFLPTMPAGRVLVPDDLVGAAVFLAGPASDMVHGHHLLVDAGYTAL